MSTIALIPARGGSKEIEKKNIKSFCGWPLIYYSLWPLINSNVEMIFVATEDAEIKEKVHEFKRSYDPKSRIAVFNRSIENAQDNSTTESVVKEFLDSTDRSLFYYSDNHFMLVQCTNPFLKSLHINDAIRSIEIGLYNSIVSVARVNRFLWKRNYDGQSMPLNYNPKQRPFRKDFLSDIFLENGSFYLADNIENLKAYNCRIYGRIGMYEMPNWSATEIDSKIDWHMAERIYRSHNPD